MKKAVKITSAFLGNWMDPTPLITLEQIIPTGIQVKDNIVYFKESLLKPLTMFYLSDCGYCDKVFRALDALYLENPAYREIAIHTIEESEHPEIADQYDYYAVPTFFCGNKKLFEAHLFMSYEAIRDEIRHVLKYAMN